ncbi:replication restart helicase PriA [Halarsenatibacter silvermanii]|uniref:Replication restart protein PriA n=1 Tax=Halarsenatibacter silvermanii TaxID=321763 RepID=A0A1G9JJ43_9FIRM|nr:primosomal protein N' [Halarsenatibacter silvermanii]SDL37559.1 replication restart DNA helicase PriA [Halarsenatibacter silvermanii]
MRKLSDKFLEVTVDVPITGSGELTYMPGKNRSSDDFSLGQQITVPLGSRKVIGYVTGFTQNPDIDHKKIKPAGDIINEKPCFSAGLIKSLKRLSSYYHTSLQSFIRAALPARVRAGKMSGTSRIHYRVPEKMNLEATIEKLKKRAPAQSRVLEFLLNREEEVMAAADIIDLAEVTRSVLYGLEEKDLLERCEITVKKSPEYVVKSSKDRSANENITLNDEQAQALNRMMPAVENEKSEVILLHGVTGSGKTELYLRLTEACLEYKRQAIILVPEISLTPYLVDFFYRKFPGRIAVMHSRLSPAERRDEWFRIRNGEASIVIGARSAVFAPLQNPGLIVIDEEHENTYKQETPPYYHARGAAVIRGQVENFPVVMGSATPSLESYHFASRGDYVYLSLDERAGGGRMPDIEIADMRQEMSDGNSNVFSKKIRKALEKRLNENEQSLIFLNRRGFANFILCQECGEALECQHCDITLTYHRTSDQLKCHYCDFSSEIPEYCPECESDLLKEFGTGTEKLETRLEELYPDAAIARMDQDTTRSKDSYKKLLSRIDRGELDIIVGTQMIAKGHDFHNITLVGVMGADTVLNLPDFRSSERAFQLLTQVAGRAGRGDKKGRVIIQSFDPEHYVLENVVGGKDHKFYDQEINLRRKLNYPPLSRLVRIIIKGENHDSVASFASELEDFIASKPCGSMTYRGPAPAPLTRIKKNYRWHMLIFFENVNSRLNYIPYLKKFIKSEEPEEINSAVDVDPLSML